MSIPQLQLLQFILSVALRSLHHVLEPGYLRGCLYTSVTNIAHADVRVRRIVLDIGFDLFVHGFDCLHDFMQIQLAIRPREVALALLDELADLLPFALGPTDAVWQSRTLQVCENSSDDGVDCAESKRLVS